MELKTKFVIYGWEGNEYEAIEFPPALAVHALELIAKIEKRDYPLLLVNACIDVLRNAEQGEITYILAPMHAHHIRDIRELEKLVKKHEAERKNNLLR